MASVESLYIYPIKSCAGVMVESLQLTELGCVDDRKWVVVDPESGRFRSLRDTPRMALVQPVLESGALRVEFPGKRSLSVPDVVTPRSTPLQVWGSACAGTDAGDAAAQWFTAALQKPCRLLRFDERAGRRINDKLAADEPMTGFADGFPLLVLSTAAVQSLAVRYGQPVDARRFRANIMLADCAPHAEDSWSALATGGLRLDLLKACARCKAITVDPLTGVISKSLMKTLLSYRRGEGGVLFGVNAVHRACGTIRAGDVARPL